MAREPITVNRTLGIVLSIVGFIFSVGTVAMVTAIIQQGNAITRLESNQKAASDKAELGLAYLGKQVESLTTAVSVGTQGRYTSAEAVADRTSIIQTFNTTREAWSLSFKGLLDANSKLAADVADLRVKIATLEARGSKP